MINLHKRMLQTGQGSNPQPPDHQSDSLQTGWPYTMKTISWITHKALLTSTQNISFHREIRKIQSGYSLLSGLILWGYFGWPSPFLSTYSLKAQFHTVESNKKFLCRSLVVSYFASSILASDSALSKIICAVVLASLFTVSASVSRRGLSFNATCSSNVHYSTC